MQQATILQMGPLKKVKNVAGSVPLSRSAPEMEGVYSA